jgi:hypothetical protein
MQTTQLIGLAFLTCFAVQVQAAGNVVKCESEHDKRVSCDMNTGGVVKIKQQLSKTRCVEDENWGITKHTVWVDKGCRAVFELQGSNNASSRSDEGDNSGYASNGNAPNSAIRACNAVEDWYGKVVSSNAMKPGWWEIILQYDDGKYVCNVSDTGEVESFEKLREPGAAAATEPPAAAVRACNAVEDWYGKVVSSNALKPGWWEIILQYDNGKYVCNVSDSGQVDTFERLRNQ